MLGNVCDWKSIYRIAKKHKLKIIEDCADTIGYKYWDSKKDETTAGKFNDLVTTSFYASHIITGNTQVKAVWYALKNYLIN